MEMASNFNLKLWLKTCLLFYVNFSFKNNILTVSSFTNEFGFELSLEPIIYFM